MRFFFTLAFIQGLAKKSIIIGDVTATNWHQCVSASIIVHLPPFLMCLQVQIAFDKNSVKSTFHEIFFYLKANFFFAHCTFYSFQSTWTSATLAYGTNTQTSVTPNIQTPIPYACIPSSLRLHFFLSICNMHILKYNQIQTISFHINHFLSYAIVKITDFTLNKSWWILSLQNCHFNILRESTFWIL